MRIRVVLPAPLGPNKSEDATGRQGKADIVYRFLGGIILLEVS